MLGKTRTLAWAAFLCATALHPVFAGVHEDVTSTAPIGPADRPVRQDNGLWTCRVNLAADTPRAFFTDQHGRRFAHMAALTSWLAASEETLLCATNGGIYGTDGRPLGWLVANGVLLQPLNLDSDHPGNFYLQPNGALVVSNGLARISSANDLVSTANGDVSQIDLALQSGPMLISHGVINPRLLPASTSRYSRNGVCVTNPRTLVMAYSDRLVSLYEFAKQLTDIGCQDALYLDGHVSQMYPIEEQLEPAQQRELSVFIGITSRTLHE